MGSGSKLEGTLAMPIRRDPYEVLCLPSRNSTNQEIKTAYQKLALNSLRHGFTCNIVLNQTMDWYHLDKNTNNPKAAEQFKEVAFSYSIVSDPEKRRQYDNAGFEAIDAESMDMEIDLSNLGTVNTMFAALFM
ncbi:hypothetical protein M0R45_009854 [Rubus argutus]|uniref:J domain-containing protein n=1 Tax=Rubus argutus TaxID=59490 RepID=A0AAW1Y876_RUBAR